MLLISKIDIEYYRSLKKVSIKNINHLNIFSGKNDIGKSNVLKALDTFFNKRKISFLDDFNKDRLNEVRLDSIKGKQFIKITIELNNPGTYKTLPKKFTISKSWDRNGNQIEGIKDNFEALVRSKKFTTTNLDIARRSLTGLLNKIRFTYIPAIRDERFFSYLLNNLQETIFKVEERKRSQTFENNITAFNKTISKLTTALNDEFESVSGISSSLSFPNNVADIFQRLIIDTKSGDYEIPLRLRGDGIRLRYIPTILNYISNNSKYLEIWGFDEPENSCEYSLSKKISEQFADEYSKRSQIFVATHSFHFISINKPNTSKFRVFRTDNNMNTNVALIDDSNKTILTNELGVLDINTELSKLYDILSKEMEHIDKTKAALKASQKPYLIFEGKTDNRHFELAYESLKGKSIDVDFTLCEHLTNSEGTAIGSSAKFINEFLYNHITKIPINNKVIAIFDADKTGIDELVALKRNFNHLDTGTDNYYLLQHKSKLNVFAMSLVPPMHRAQFFAKGKSNYCYVSTELLYEDIAIPNTNKYYPTLYDRTVFSFTGDKPSFADSISSNKATTDFSGFTPSFDLIEYILSL